MSLGQPDGRRNIVECAVGPDAKVIKRYCENNLVWLRRAAWRQGHTEIHNAILMIPISSKITAELIGMGIQHLVKDRDVSD